MASLALLLAASALAVAAACASVAHFSGNAVERPKVILVFELRGRDCPGPDCFASHAHVLKFNAVNTSYPNCPEVLEGYFESEKAVPVGKNGSFESHEKGFYSEDISFGGRFLDEGRRARGWYTVEEAGCTTGRVHWKAELE